MDAEWDDGQRTEAESWLDAALQARMAEPRIGLEERVLARLADQPAKKSLVWWPALTAAAVMVVIAMAVGLMHESSKRMVDLAGNLSPSEIAKATKVSPSKPSRVLSSGKQELSSRAQIPRRDVSRGGLRLEAKLAVSKREELPKLATFPAPAPETGEERLLQRLASRRQPPSGQEVTNVAQLPSVSQFTIHPMEEPPSGDVPQD